MAPLETNATMQSNRLAIALFSGQTLLVAALTGHVLLKARRAAHSLPPSTATRAQSHARRRHAITLSILAFLSLASVTTFAVMWRALSYLHWAETGNHETPGSLWTGWYGTGDEGVGTWRLGDWLSDTDLIRASDEVAIAKPEAFLYTAQHFVALVANSIFMGVQGRRRNLSTYTIASFVVLSAIGSLGYALNLFFIVMLYTPLVKHSEGNPRRDPLFAPNPAVFYVPVLISIFALHTLPGQLKANKDVILLRWGYLLVPLFLAFAPQIVPVSWGQHHISKTSAHRSYARAFYVLSCASFVLHWKLFGFATLASTPPDPASVYDLLKHAVGKQSRSTSNRLLEGVSHLGQKLKPISIHPAVSVTTMDVLFTAISLYAWAFIRDLDVEAMLNNSVLSFLVPNKTEKHVAFDSKAEKRQDIELEEPMSVITPRKRGRPRKSTLTNGTSSSSTPFARTSLRRSTREKSRSELGLNGEDAYEPSSAASRDLNQTETDGATTTDDVVGSSESTALAMFLAFIGGLGQVSASVMGAEVTQAAE